MLVLSVDLVLSVLLSPCIAVVFIVCLPSVPVLEPGVTKSVFPSEKTNFVVISVLVCFVVKLSRDLLVAIDDAFCLVNISETLSVVICCISEAILLDDILGWL